MASQLNVRFHSFSRGRGERNVIQCFFYSAVSPYPGDLSAPESSELDLERKRQQLQDPVLMPLPDSGADGPLDWAHLVDAAKAFEGRLTSCFHFTLKII